MTRDRKKGSPSGPYAPDGDPSFDDGAARELIGKYVLVGITYVDAKGEVKNTVQCHGPIVRSDASGVAIKCEGLTWNGQEAVFPPDSRSYEPASPGEYKLKSTGEVVIDPDIVMSWTVQAPQKH